MINVEGALIPLANKVAGLERIITVRIIAIVLATGINQMGITVLHVSNKALTRTNQEILNISFADHLILICNSSHGCCANYWWKSVVGYG